jgi:hypothetical protein
MLAREKAGNRCPPSTASPAHRVFYEEARTMSSTIPNRPTEPERHGPSGGVGGWVMFAGVIMLVLGLLDVLWGLAAVINDEVVSVGGRGGVVVWDVSAWGWGHLIIGAIVALTGLGLLAGQSWARWVGIFFVSLDALAQFGSFDLTPLWSITLIGIDVLILYQLTAGWRVER